LTANPLRGNISMIFESPACDAVGIDDGPTMMADFSSPGALPVPVRKRGAES
jgi:hypothetical protein